MMMTGMTKKVVTARNTTLVQKRLRVPGGGLGDVVDAYLPSSQYIHPRRRAESFDVRSVVGEDSFGDA